ncbi:MAG TPA: TetR/AcrR family transcriptional regulator [Flexivirga sp.]|uniref:TetR/AcrR family transcriptional regulator n=1 Tax=Flexivirga sp. TaxID=1962927 RepID=UPI002C43048D|nr:TetR/AcrR family transcriptional regulator [Flexivirga sp.]HWC20670.1 TetR/AcrR family transcriptional regulator [Flexivirga sp.]
MARPRSETRRAAILTAAASVIATEGLTAPTAAIAKQAGVSNGSLFLYFDTKTTLFNELYVALKTEMGEAAVEGLPETGDARKRLRHLWTRWLRWATSNPEKRRALAQLEVADEVTAESHRLVRDTQRDMAELLETCREGGPVQDVPLSFVLILTGAIADATMDAMIREPGNADSHSATAFEAVWRVIAGPTAH